MSSDQTLLRAGVQMSSLSPDPGLNQEIKGIKEEPEEQSVKQEEEQLPVSVPVSSACMKRKEYSLLPQTQSEPQTQGEDISSEPDREKMETEVDGDHYNKVQTRDRSTTPQNSALSAPEISASVSDEDLSGAEGAEGKKHQCSVCKKRFGTKQILQNHIRVHTGERPYSCSTCEKTFAQKSALDYHMRTHTGDKPYSCSMCNKTFVHKGHLQTHTRSHTGDKPYSCSICQKTFSRKNNLQVHMRTHRESASDEAEGKKHECPFCLKRFWTKQDSERHIRVHTGERPFSCSTCKKAFVHEGHLQTHMRTHTGDKPYSCSLCPKTFAQKSHLDSHMKTHTGDRLSNCSSPRRSLLSAESEVELCRHKEENVPRAGGGMPSLSDGLGLKQKITETLQL